MSKSIATIMTHFRTIILLTAFLFSVTPILAGNDKTASTANGNNDPVTVSLTKETVKSGWSLGLLPAFAYNNDLGFLIGALGQVYDYGDGSIYPFYRHKFMANVNIYSRGAKQINMNYDSKYLIPGLRVTADLSFMDNPLCGFYGFNGAVSPYHADLDLKKNAEGTEGIAFYSIHQRQLKASLDLQGHIAEGLTWIGGASYAWQRYSDVAFRVYDGTESLFHQYVESGLISDSDIHGHRVEVKGGLVYDTRDLEANPTKGLYATVTTTGGASFSSETKASLVLSADFRQYIPLWPDHITLAWQVAYKGLVAGALPFYALPAFSMRGSFGSRIAGNGVAWASVDLRVKLASFQALKQDFELGLVGFADAGAVVQPYKLAEQMALGASIYDPQIATRERLHTSAGGGFWFSMNRNFIVAAEVGRPLNPQDGTFGVYLNLGFSF